MNDFSHQKITEKVFGDKEDLYKEYCLLPDKDEKQRCFSSHFYNPVTGQCYRKSYDSAKNRLIYWLGKFIISEYSPFFGRAIHYLEDICTPVHTQYQDSFDAIYRSNLHVDFEKGLDKYISEKGLPISIKPKSIFCISKLIDSCALQSAEIYYRYRDFSNFEESYLKTCQNAISALFSLIEIIPNLKAKIINYNDFEIVVIESDDKILAACLDFNTCLKVIDKKKIYVFCRESEIKNFEFKEVINGF